MSLNVTSGYNSSQFFLSQPLSNLTEASLEAYVTREKSNGVIASQETQAKRFVKFLEINQHALTTTQVNLIDAVAKKIQQTNPDSYKTFAKFNDAIKKLSTSTRNIESTKSLPSEQKSFISTKKTIGIATIALAALAVHIFY